MRPEEIKDLLTKVKQGKINIDRAFEAVNL